MKALYIITVLLLLTVDLFSQLAATYSVDKEILCKGANDGAVSILVQDGLPPYSYQWFDGGADAARTDLSAGLYEVTVTDSNDDIVTVLFELDESNILIASNTVLKNVTCFGGADGSAEISAVGGNGLYTYEWGEGQDDFNRADLIAGTYEVTVSDENGCEAVTSFLIDEIDLQVYFNITSGCSPLVISDFKNASEGGESYVWDFGNGNTSIDENPSFVYENGSNEDSLVTVSLTATSLYGCELTHDTTITVYKKPIADFDFSGDMYSGMQISFVDISNTYGFTRTGALWNFADGTVINSTDNQTHVFQNADNYSVRYVIEIENGCTDTIVKEVELQESPDFLIAADGDLEFCDGDSVMLSIVDDFDFAVQWFKGEEEIAGATQTRLLVKESGDYFAIMTKGNLTVSTDVVTVNEYTYPNAFIIDAIGKTQFCDGDSIMLEIPNSAGYIYKWKRDGIALNWTGYIEYAKDAGEYTVAVSNKNCETQAGGSVTIELDESPQINKQLYKSGETSFCEGDSVNLFITGNPQAYTIEWLRGDDIIQTDNLILTVKSSGTYTLVATNDKGCRSKTNAVSVNADSYPEVPVIEKPEVLSECKGNVIPLQVNSLTGVNHTWKYNGIVVAKETPVYKATNSGTYTVLSHMGMCVQEKGDTINLEFLDGPIAPFLSFDGDLKMCENDSVILSYTKRDKLKYTWLQDGQPFENEANKYITKQAGTFAIVVEDTVACTDTSDIVTTEQILLPANPSIFSDEYVEICEGDSAKLFTDFVPEVEYLWKQGNIQLPIDSSTVYGYAGGLYTLTLKQEKCYSSSQDTVYIVVVPVPEKPLINISGETAFCQGDSITLSTKEQVSIDNYKWYKGINDLGIDNSELTVKQNGKYYLKVYNEYNCFAEADDAVDVIVYENPSIPTIVAVDDISLLCEGDTVVLSSETNDALTYKWSKDGGDLLVDNDTLVVTNSGDYSLSVIENGCETQAGENITVIFNRKPDVGNSLAYQTDSDTICMGDSMELSVTLNSAFAYNYLWYKDGATLTEESEKLTVSDYGEYYAVVSHPGFGCSVVTKPVNVTTVPVPNISEIESVNYMEDMCMGDYITLSVDKQTGFSYQWYLNNSPLLRDTTTVIEGILDGGIYKVEVYNAFCSRFSNTLHVKYDESPEQPTIHYLGDDMWYLVADTKGGTEYKWFLDDEEIAGAHKYYYEAEDNLGTYRVAMKTEEYECFSFSKELLIPDDTWYFATNTFEADDVAVSLFPNPAENSFSVLTNSTYMGTVEIELTTIDGNVIYSVQANKQSFSFEHRINLNNGYRGVLFVKVVSGKQVDVKKVVIK